MVMGFGDELVDKMLCMQVQRLVVSGDNVIGRMQWNCIICEQGDQLFCCQVILSQGLFGQCDFVIGNGCINDQCGLVELDFVFCLFVFYVVCLKL